MYFARSIALRVPREEEPASAAPFIKWARRAQLHTECVRESAEKPFEVRIASAERDDARIVLRCHRRGAPLDRSSRSKFGRIAKATHSCNTVSFFSARVPSVAKPLFGRRAGRFIFVRPSGRGAKVQDIVILAQQPELDSLDRLDIDRSVRALRSTAHPSPSG